MARSNTIGCRNEYDLWRKEVYVSFLAKKRCERLSRLLRRRIHKAMMLSRRLKYKWKGNRWSVAIVAAEKSLAFELPRDILYSGHQCKCWACLSLYNCRNIITREHATSQAWHAFPFLLDLFSFLQVLKRIYGDVWISFNCMDLRMWASRDTHLPRRIPIDLAIFGTWIRRKRALHTGSDKILLRDSLLSRLHGHARK